MVFANIFNIKFLHGYFIFFFFWRGGAIFFFFIIANILHIVCFCRMFAKNLDIDFKNFLILFFYFILSYFIRDQNVGVRLRKS